MEYTIIKDLSAKQDNSVLHIKTANNEHLIRKKITDTQIPIYKTLMDYQTQAKNSNTGLAHIESIETEDQGIFVYEELIKGNTLELHLQNGLFTEEEALKTLVQLCDILKPIHEQKIIHRDITQKNVLIDFEGNLKLIDFGISRISKGTKTQDTTFYGTWGYAAPEVGHQETKQTADIYSLGVLLNVMLTGHPKNLGSYNQNKKIAKIIKKCTHMDPGSRYQTVAELKRDILWLEKAENNPVKGFLAILPGYRGNKLLPKIIATYIYLCYIAVAINFYFLWHSSITDIVLVTGANIFTFIIPYFLLGFKNIREKIPFIRKYQKHILSYVLTGIITLCSLILGAYFLSLVAV